jgi:hypothetical protein
LQDFSSRADLHGYNLGKWLDDLGLHYSNEMKTVLLTMRTGADAAHFQTLLSGRKERLAASVVAIAQTIEDAAISSSSAAAAAAAPDVAGAGPANEAVMMADASVVEAV